MVVLILNVKINNNILIDYDRITESRLCHIIIIIIVNIIIIIIIELLLLLYHCLLIAQMERGTLKMFLSVVSAF